MEQGRVARRKTVRISRPRGFGQGLVGTAKVGGGCSPFVASSGGEPARGVEWFEQEGSGGQSDPIQLDN